MSSIDIAVACALPGAALMLYLMFALIASDSTRRTAILNHSACWNAATPSTTILRDSASNIAPASIRRPTTKKSRRRLKWKRRVFSPIWIYRDRRRSHFRLPARRLQKGLAAFMTSQFFLLFPVIADGLRLAAFNLLFFAALLATSAGTVTGTATQLPLAKPLASRLA